MFDQFGSEKMSEKNDKICVLLKNPPEIMLHILKYLSPTDLINFGLCSKLSKEYAIDTLR